MEPCSTRPFIILTQMKKECEVLINESNKGRSNIYYQLNQLKTITGLSDRMLKYKMKEVKQKYGNIPKLLKKDGKKWQIHSTLVNLFMPVKVLKMYNQYNFNWSTFVTWNTQLSYDAGYHVELINQIKKELPSNSVIKYSVEVDGRGYNHIHFLTNTTATITKKAVDKVLINYLAWYEVNVEVTDIINHYSNVNYINKASVTSGVI